MTRRIESLVLLAMAGVTGAIFAFTRGLWSAAPLLIIAAAGCFFHLMPPVPPEQPGRVMWANLNLLALVVALASTWFQSPAMLAVGLVMVVTTLVVPLLLHRN